MEDNKGIEGVAALLVWIGAGKMRGREEEMQQITFKAAEMRVHAT